jgi:DNA-binding CsgD family transcriptional regulator
MFGGIDWIEYTNAPIARDAIWSALTQDSGSAVIIISDQLRFLFVNHVAAAILDRKPDDLRDASLHDVLGTAVHHWARAVEHVLQSREPLVDFEFIGGVLHRRTMRAVATHDHEHAILCVCRPNPDETPPSLHARAIRVRDGILDHLTPREITVLAMIGAGLRNNEIARRIARSTRTVDGYCYRLLGKLRVRSRTRLAAIAIRAGLVARDGAIVNVLWNEESPRPAGLDNARTGPDAGK